MDVARVFDHSLLLPLPLVTRRRRRLDVRGNYWRAVLESTGQQLAVTDEGAAV